MAVALAGALLATFALGGGIGAAQNDPPAKAAEAEHQAGIEWFRGAKFGLFLHWGLYTVPAGEWNGNKGLGEWFQIETRMPGDQYAKFADQFNPAKFDAKEWVKHVKDAGIRYIVITTKHHDGFAMYDSKVSDFSIVKSTPWHRDPMKDLAAACQEAGIQLVLLLFHPRLAFSRFPGGPVAAPFPRQPEPRRGRGEIRRLHEGADPRTPDAVRPDRVSLVR